MIVSVLLPEGSLQTKTAYFVLQIVLIKHHFLHSQEKTKPCRKRFAYSCSTSKDPTKLFQRSTGEKLPNPSTGCLGAVRLTSLAEGPWRKLLRLYILKGSKKHKLC